ncbi:MAG: BlaI/MecI/CopY family transcriptional regulator [Candidatus Hydrothermarchaeota archaeon]
MYMLKGTYREIMELCYSKGEITSRIVAENVYSYLEKRKAMINACRALNWLCKKGLLVEVDKDMDIKVYAPAISKEKYNKRVSEGLLLE